MIDHERIQSAPSRELEVLEFRGGVVSQRSKSCAVLQNVLHFALPAGKLATAQLTQLISRNYSPVVRSVLSAAHRTKPIAHSSCRGLVQSIFRSPAPI
jgi:hypothetical protein